jgi:hypothetical protein
VVVDNVALLNTHKTEGVTDAMPGTGGPVPTFKKMELITFQQPVAPPDTIQVYVMGVVILAMGFGMVALLSPVDGNHA